VKISGKEDRSMLKKILIGTDGSDHARKAIEYCEILPIVTTKNRVVYGA